MARIGAGLEAQKLQRGETSTPTPSESLKTILQSTIGSLSESVDLQGEAEAAPVEQETREPLSPRVTGFNEDDTLVPISQRVGPASTGELNPTFDDWRSTGQQTEGSIPQPQAPAYKLTNESPPAAMLNRAKRTAARMDPSNSSEGSVTFSGTQVDTANREAYIAANKKIDLALDEEERNAAKRERYKIVKSVEDKKNTILQTMSGNLDALVVDPTSGFATPDPRFLITAQIATENELDMMFLGAQDEVNILDEDDIIDDNDQEGKGMYSTELINPADAAERTGRAIGTWWNAEKEGKTTASKMSGLQNKDLGMQHLLAFAEANPEMVSMEKVRVNDKGRPDANGEIAPWRFRLTPYGADVLEHTREFRQKALGINIAPESHPAHDGLQADKAQLRPAFRKKGAIGGNSKDPSYSTLSEIEEAIYNQQGVGHVVDNRRMRVAMTLLFPTLFGKIGDPNDVFGDGFGLGRESFDTLVREKMDLDGMEHAQAVDTAVKITGMKKNDAASDIKTLSMYRKGVNYLTYAMQPLAGRQMVQQTEFNPTRKKIVRAVTRAIQPAIIRGRSGRVYDAYMNIAALNFGKDNLLPKGRMADLQDNRAMYYSWGKILEDALNEAFPASSLEPAMEAIANGTATPDMAQSLQKFTMLIKKDENLTPFLKRKGEDAIAAIDALIDFKNFNDAMDQGKPFKTHLNGYIDGKTNGVANQGAMLGNLQLAYRVGVLRDDGSEEAVNNGDLRDWMEEIILDRLIATPTPTIPSDKASGKTENIRDVLKAVASFRPINKTVTMVFPYGKELAGLKAEIRKHIPELRTAQPDINSKIESLEASGITLDNLVDAAHDSVVHALFEIFGTDTFNARGVMRSVGYMHAMFDKLFSIRGPSGHRILLGQGRPDESQTQTSKIRVRSDNVDATMNLQDSPMRASSAAKKDGEAAGYVRGRSSVIPTQSMDAAVVTRTFSGNSWKVITDDSVNGEPYVFQIYDAYKVDANSYHSVLKEVNKNFVDITTRDWNFIEEAKKEYQKFKDDTKRVLESAPDKTWTFKDGTFDYMHSLMDPEWTPVGGNLIARRSAMKAFISAAFPIDPDRNVVYRDNNIMARKDSDKPQIAKDRVSEYQKYVSTQASILQAELYEIFNEISSSNINSDSFLNGDSVPELITSREALAIISAVEKRIQLMGRLQLFTEKTNRNRKILRDKVLAQEQRTGLGALQFWAH